MKDFYESLSRVIATVFFIGYIPFAPGTFGSLAGFLFIYLAKPSDIYLLFFIIIIFILGVWSSSRAESYFKIKDSSPIVIDEFAGYLVSVVFLPITIGYLTAAFFLFRVLDILKPPPIRNIEKMFKGGMGVMLDDVAAGIFTNLILQLWRFV